MCESQRWLKHSVNPINNDSLGNTMSNLPPSVQAQADRAEEIQRQLANPKQDLAPNPDQGTELQAAPEAKPEAKPQASPAKNDDVVYWKNRFTVMEGKYKAELPRLRQREKELLGEVASLKGQLEGQPASTTSGFTQEEVDEYGEDFLAMVDKAAKRNANPEVVERLEEHVNRVEDDQHDNRQARYLTEIDLGVPDWRAINDKAEWLDWLSATDPFSGFTRQSLLDKAQNEMDSTQIIQIFNTFKKSRPTSKVPAAKVHPSAIDTSQPPAEGAVITRASIKAFYAAKTRGDYRNNADKARAIEQQINQAVAQGNVRG